MKEATLLFLLRKDEQTGGDEILLAMKKRGFGVGKWNGVGGKFDDTKDTTIEETAKREAFEEVGLIVLELDKIAVNSFHFPLKPGNGMNVHVYLSRSWMGDAVETEEMKPQWFALSDIPYDEMWDDDKIWMPKMLEGKKFKAAFSFDENDKVSKQQFSPFK